MSGVSPDSSQPFSATSSFGNLSAEERQWALFAHLSGFVAASLGGLGFLGPMVIWLIKRETMPFVNDHGKEALNFQLSLLLYVFLTIPTVLLISLFTYGLGLLLFMPFGVCVALFGIICPIMAALAANRGEQFRYPLTIRFIA